MKEYLFCIRNVMGNGFWDAAQGVREPGGQKVYEKTRERPPQVFFHKRQGGKKFLPKKRKKQNGIDDRGIDAARGFYALFTYGHKQDRKSVV